MFAGFKRSFTACLGTGGLLDDLENAQAYQASTQFNFQHGPPSKRHANSRTLDTLMQPRAAALPPLENRLAAFIREPFAQLNLGTAIAPIPPKEPASSTPFISGVKPSAIVPPALAPAHLSARQPGAPTALASFNLSIDARVAHLRREKLEQREAERRVREEAERSAKTAHYARLRALQERSEVLHTAVVAMRPRQPALTRALDAVTAQRDELVAPIAALVKAWPLGVAASRTMATEAAPLDDGSASLSAAQLAQVSAHIESASLAVEAALAAARSVGVASGGALSSALMAARGLRSDLSALLWDSEDGESPELLLTHFPLDHAAVAPLVRGADACVAALGSHVELATKASAELHAAADAISLAKGKVAARAPKAAPPGSRTIPRTPLSAAEELEVDAALAPGPNDLLVEFENIPVRRNDMGTVRPSQWLNDEVINLFIKLLTAREGTKPAEWPTCAFMQSNFYTKLADGPNGYTYKDVRRWTKKADVFAKDLLIFPIHCHGNQCVRHRHRSAHATALRTRTRPAKACTHTHTRAHTRTHTRTHTHARTHHTRTHTHTTHTMLPLTSLWHA